MLTRSNCIIWKIGTNYTQCVHRLRLRPIKPQYELHDIPNLDPNSFTADPSLTPYRSEPALFDKFLPDMLNSERTSTEEVEIPVPPDDQVTTTLNFPVVQPVQTVNTQVEKRTQSTAHEKDSTLGTSSRRTI